MELLITGGTLREGGYELGEGKYYGCARLVALDTATGRTRMLLSVDVGGPNVPAEHPNLEFTVGAVDGQRLWLPMDTEIRQYDFPSLNLLSTYSYPCFHNIHSVAVQGDALYVTSTGLDMVVVLDKADGSVREMINTEGKPLWHRFDPDTDYRQMHSTRPHDCHPNHVFWLDGLPWVTRCTQEDAVRLGDVSQRWDVSRSRRPISVHDGVPYEGRVYFTSVDGCLIAVDPKHPEDAELIDLSALKGFGGLRGWCRGLHLQDGLAYVGFSRLRRTRKMERLHWVGKLLRNGQLQDSSVLVVDLARRQIVADHRFTDLPLDAIYGLLPTPAQRVED